MTGTADVLPHEGSGRRQCAMDHDRFPEGGGNDIEGASERGEDDVRQLLTDRVQPEFLPDQRDPSAEDDPPGATSVTAWFKACAIASTAAG